MDNLTNLLSIHAQKNSKDYYLAIRGLNRDKRFNLLTDTEKAARLLYMLRVDFNGLYRVNAKNQFNVPYGRYKNPKIIDRELLHEISDYLSDNEIEILNVDFVDAVKEAREGDFVYFDPPYAPVSATSDFTSYTHEGFDNRDQERLRDLFLELTYRGVNVMLSNSDVEFIHELYADLPKVNITVVGATRMINANAAGRGKINVLIIRNYE